MRTPWSLIWICPAVVSAAACGSPGPGASPRPVAVGPGSLPSAPVHGQEPAEALARSLVDQVTLPPGSRIVTTAPTRGLEQPPQQPGTPNLADATRFAVVPLDPAAVLDFARTHPPAGYTEADSGSGSTSGPDQPTEQYLMENVSGLPTGVESATILVAVVDAGGGSHRSDVRLDAEVTWLPVKPAGLSVPPDDQVAVVALTESQRPQPQLGLPAPRQVTITDPSMFDRLRSAADGLQPALPGTRHCPADLGTRYHVAFEPTAGDGPNITFTAGSCGEVTVTRTDGTTGELSDDAAFYRAYRSALGLTAP